MGAGVALQRVVSTLIVVGVEVVAVGAAAVRAPATTYEYLRIRLRYYTRILTSHTTKLHPRVRADAELAEMAEPAVRGGEGVVGPLRESLRWRGAAVV